MTLLWECGRIRNCIRLLTGTMWVRYPPLLLLCRYSLTARTLGFHPRDRSSILRSDTCPFYLMAKCQLGRLVTRVRFPQRAYVWVCKLESILAVNQASNDIVGSNPSLHTCCGVNLVIQLVSYAGICWFDSNHHN